MKKIRNAGIMLLASATVLVGCSSAPAEPEATETAAQGQEDLVELLGGQETHDALMAQYEAAVEAGETKVTIYGAEAQNMIPVLQPVWEQAFPEITLEGVQLTSGQAGERLRAESATGQGTGDVYDGGPAVLANHEELFTDLDKLVELELDPEWYGPKGFTTVGLTPFTFVYNPETVSEDELPTDWSDLLDEQWKDRLSLWDPSQSIGLDTIATLLYQDIWTEDDVTALADNNPTIVPLPDIIGTVTNVSNGQSDGGFWTTLPQVLAAIDSGAPVESAFPLENNNVLSRQMIGLLESAPSPEAATLYANWRLTPAGADALAEYGLYSLVPGADAPEGFPTFDQLDVLPVLPYEELMDQANEARPVVKDAFGL